MRNRFVNNEILACTCRPQYRYGCAIAALATVINYLYSSKLGIIKQEQIAEELGMEIQDIGTSIDPGNEDVMEWFARFVQQRKLHGRARIFLNRKKDEEYVALKRVVKSPDKILMYHLENHYNIVCGFYESATKPTDAYSGKADTEKWLILADQYDDPIWCRSWKDVLRSFRRWNSYCLILFEAHARTI
jgi:hypothetical protein